MGGNCSGPEKREESMTFTRRQQREQSSLGKLTMPECISKSPFLSSVSAWTAGWTPITASAGSADFQSAVSQVSNLRLSESFPTALPLSWALPTGSRRHSRLEICATRKCRPSHSLLSKGNSASFSAFTLIELLIVIAIIPSWPRCCCRRSARPRRRTKASNARAISGNSLWLGGFTPRTATAGSPIAITAATTVAAPTRRLR